MPLQPDLFGLLKLDGDEAFLRHIKGSLSLVLCFLDLP